MNIEVGDVNTLSPYEKHPTVFPDHEWPMNLLTQSAKAKLSAWLCNSEFKLNFKIPLVNDTQHIVVFVISLFMENGNEWYCLIHISCEVIKCKCTLESQEVLEFTEEQYCTPLNIWFGFPRTSEVISRLLVSLRHTYGQRSGFWHKFIHGVGKLF